MKLIYYGIVLLFCSETFLFSMNEDEGRYCIDIHKSVAAVKEHIKRNDLEKIMGGFSIISLTMIPEKATKELSEALTKNIAHQKKTYENNIDYVLLLSGCGMACYGAYQAFAGIDKKFFYLFRSAALSLIYGTKLIHDDISNISGKKNYLDALAIKSFITSPNNNSSLTKNENFVSILKIIKKRDVEKFLGHTPHKVDTFSCN